MPRQKKKTLEDLDPLLVKELEAGIKFGRIDRIQCRDENGDPKVADHKMWILDLSPKEHLECAKIRLGYIKEALAYSKAKIKATEIGKTNSPEDVLSGLSEDELDELLGESDAKLARMAHGEKTETDTGADS